jgi:hypothetical protein
MVEYGLAKEPNETQYPLDGPGLKQADDAYRELEENVRIKKTDTMKKTRNCMSFFFFLAISLFLYHANANT